MQELASTRRKPDNTRDPLRNCWGTPDDLFAREHAEYNFTVDACALPFNAKLPRYWAPRELVLDMGEPAPAARDGLAQDWTGERVWCNPPYGRGLIEPWVFKALDSRAQLTALLLPSRTDTDWFQRLHGHSRVRIEFLPKRVRFVPPPGVKASSPTEASILVVVR